MRSASGTTSARRARCATSASSSSYKNAVKMLAFDREAGHGVVEVDVVGLTVVRKVTRGVVDDRRQQLQPERLSARRALLVDDPDHVKARRRD